MMRTTSVHWCGRAGSCPSANPLHRRVRTHEANPHCPLPSPKTVSADAPRSGEYRIASRPRIRAMHPAAPDMRCRRSHLSGHATAPNPVGLADDPSAMSTLSGICNTQALVRSRSVGFGGTPRSVLHVPTRTGRDIERRCNAPNRKRFNHPAKPAPSRQASTLQEPVSLLRERSADTSGTQAPSFRERSYGTTGTAQHKKQC